MAIKFIDLFPQYLAHKQEIDDAMQEVIDDTAFVRSSPVKAFEDNFSKFLGGGEVVSCGNGTDALEIILDAYGIGEGDEVIVPAVSWISTSEVVHTRGATPVFVDISLETYGLDTSAVEDAITDMTKAIIVVHLYGYPLDIERLVPLSRKRNIHLIEDCAQAHGATLRGKKVGTLGDAASFSFFPTKNLGAMGDAGCMVFQDSGIAIKARAIANHGQITRHNHEFSGRNSRMDGLQAAVLNVKLKYLDQHIKLRREKASLYKKLLAELDEIDLPSTPDRGKHAYHLFVIRSKRRQKLKDFLKEEGIPSQTHYPTALPFQPVYGQRGFTKEDFPNAHLQQETALSLPFYPEIPEEDIHFVSEKIKDFFNG